MNDRNRYHEPICEFSDLPTAMCAHCSGKTGNPEPIGLHALPSKPGRPVELGSYRGLGYCQPAIVPMPSSGRICDCGRPAGDAFCCPACIDMLEVHLGDVPALIEDLEVAAQRRDRVRSAPRIPHLQPDTQRIFDGWPGFREDMDPEAIVTAQLVASDAAQRWFRLLGRTRPDKAAAGAAMDALRASLVSAAKALLEPLGQTWTGDDACQAISLWLLQHSASIALSPAGPDICDDLRRVHRRCVAIIDSAPEMIHYGNCGGCGSSIDVPAGASAWQCDECGAAYSVEELEQWRRDLAADQLGTVSELVEWARTLGSPVGRATIQRWAALRRIESRGKVLHEGNLAPVYRLGDVLDVAAARTAAGASPIPTSRPTCPTAGE